MPEIILRKTVMSVEEIFHEGGPIADKHLIKASLLSIIQNPFAGSYHEHIQCFMDDLKSLGLSMAHQLVDRLGGYENVEGYGKGALIGEAGELEHGALWHAPGGYAMRELLREAKAIVPSAKKIVGVGGRLDVPITHINASYVRSHLDSMEVGSHDSPRANEMVLALVMTTGGRIHARSGGLQASQIEGKDGLR